MKERNEGRERTKEREEISFLNSIHVILHECKVLKEMRFKIMWYNLTKNKHAFKSCLLLSSFTPGIYI
jgi:hypothetical protein